MPADDLADEWRYPDPRRAAANQAVAIEEMRKRGLLTAKDQRISVRMHGNLLKEARIASGIADTADLLTYALAKVVLEDDFADRLLARKGSIPKGVLFEG